MLTILILAVLSVAVIASWLTVAHWIRRHAEPKRPPLVVIEGGRTFRA